MPSPYEMHQEMRIRERQEEKQRQLEKFGFVVRRVDELKRFLIEYEKLDGTHHTSEIWAVDRTSALREFEAQMQAF